jgi:mRNA interferase HigB
VQGTQSTNRLRILAERFIRAGSVHSACTYVSNLRTSIVNVISAKGLRDLAADKSRDVQKDVQAWYKIARAAKWRRFEDVQRSVKDADMVKGLLVFNICRNRYRLIVSPVFVMQRLYVKGLLTQKEYERGGWRK